jgi:hypothetical protein
LRFTIIKDLKQDRSMRPILNGLLIFTIMYLIADLFVIKSSLGLFEQEIYKTLYGDKDEFLDPMSKSIFLEFIHTQIFFMMMIIFTLSTVYMRLAFKLSYSLFAVNTLLVSAFMSLILLGLSYYVEKDYISLYVITFFIWHIVAFYMAIFCIWSLSFAKCI